jgi:hypothetical protein
LQPPEILSLEVATFKGGRSAGSVLSLVMGSLALLERRRLRRAKAAEGNATVSA